MDNLTKSRKSIGTVTLKFPQKKLKKIKNTYISFTSNFICIYLESQSEINIWFLHMKT